MKVRIICILCLIVSASFLMTSFNSPENFSESNAAQTSFFRFTDNGDGTVTDNQTGLVWLRDANFAATVKYDPDETGSGKMQWESALDFITRLNKGKFDAAGSGNCGYSDWRLPTAKELSSLVHFGYSNPALSNDRGTGHWADDEDSSFSNVLSEDYWSGTGSADVRTLTRVVYLYNGNVRNGFKSFGRHYVWPVRSDQSRVSVQNRVHILGLSKRSE